MRRPSKLRIEIDSLPTEIDEVDRRVMQLEIELTSLAKETDDASAARREALVARARRAARALRRDEGAVAVREGRDRAISEHPRRHSRPPAARSSAPSAPPTSARRRASLRGESPSSRRRSAEREAAVEAAGATVFLKEEVDADDVADVVATWTGIPVSRLLESEVAKLVHMEERLHERVIGQGEAVERSPTSIRRSAPRALGPPTGRSAPSSSGPDRRRQDRARTARARRVPLTTPRTRCPHDMSEVHGAPRVSRLVGRAPGYIGYDEGRPADQAVRRRPYFGGAARTRSRRPTRRLQHAASPCSTTAA